MGPCFLSFRLPPSAPGDPLRCGPKTFFESSGWRFWAGLLNMVGEPSITFFVLTVYDGGFLLAGYHWDPYFFIRCTWISFLPSFFLLFLIVK